MSKNIFGIGYLKEIQGKFRLTYGWFEYVDHWLEPKWGGYYEWFKSIGEAELFAKNKRIIIRDQVY